MPGDGGASEADRLIAALGLAAHPEGGHFRETWREPSDVYGPGRGAGTSIYYLLKEGEVSAWHRIDATEIWHFYAGAPLILGLRDESGTHERILGPDIDTGAHPQIVIAPHIWQTARTTGAFTLVGCTVSPAFVFSGFELFHGANG